MTLIPDHVIKEALSEGGYKPDLVVQYWRCPVNEGRDAPIDMPISSLLLDAEFWKALSRSRQWPECPEPSLCASNGNCRGDGTWQNDQLRFITLLQSKPSQEQIDQFWSQLP